MRFLPQLLGPLSAALALTACGGSGGSAGDQTPKATFAAMVSFGDSLSDVGTYRVGTEPPRDSWRPVGVSQADVADSAS